MRPLAVSVMLFSCGVGVSPVFEPSVEAPGAAAALTLEQRLAADEAPLLRVLPSESRGTIEARRAQWDAAYSVVELRATGGELLAHLVPQQSGSALQLDRFDVRLADVPVFDTGLVLTGLHFHLVAAEPARVTWSRDRGFAAVELGVTMTVSGLVRGQSGAASPFESQTFSGVPLSLGFALDAAGGVVARFRTQGDAAASWNWADLIETGAARFEGSATEFMPQPPPGAFSG
jgi:hypothetical protein